MFKEFTDYLRLAAAYARFNLRAHLEYRAAFVWEVTAMFVNDGIWLAYWAVFFTEFPVLNGWVIADVVTMWAVVATGFGLAAGFMGNTLGLARLIAEGQLDAWLLYPRQPLAHLLLGRMSATAWGDVLFGIVVYLVFVRPDPGRLVLFLLLSVTAAGVFVGFSILSASLSFYLGNGSPLSDQWRTAMMTFSTYPSTLFRGGAKLVLFTFIPAGFVSTLPVEALRTLSVWNTLLAIGGSAGVLGAGVLVFQHGLRRYESGNLILMRE